MSINHIAPKIKSFRSSFNKADFFIVFIIILVSFGSFGLGRLSKINENKEPLKISMNGADITASAGNAVSIPVKSSESTESLSSRFVASKRGKKYYGEDCPAAKNIKEENKIYFNSSAEAESGGYTASSSC